MTLSFIHSCLESLAPYLILGLLAAVLAFLFDVGGTRSNGHEVVLVYRNGAGSPPVTRACSFLKRPLDLENCRFTAISSAGRPHCTKAMALPSGCLPKDFQLPADQNADSDLVRAFGLAARAFASGNGREHTLLVAQNGMTRQFRGLDLASADPEELLQKLDDEGLIPDLNWANVRWYYFYDCCGAMPDMTVAECRYAQLFWEGFLRRANVTNFTFCAELPAPSEEVDAVLPTAPLQEAPCRT